MMINRKTSQPTLNLFSFPFLIILLMSFFLSAPMLTARAAAVLEVIPLTWNVIGLDSNNTTVGPNDFPIGAKVCNKSLTDIAHNVKSAFVFDDGAGFFYPANPYINLRDGTLSAHTSDGIDLAPGGCTEFYYEVAVTRTSSAYNKTRRYHITASSDGGAVTGSTPTPRELFVEHLVSQSRNAVTDVRLNGVSIPAGGTMALVVGGTYSIELVGYTATQGYNQLESFINFPNTIFQVLSVASTYTAPPGTTSDTLYADSCGWDNILSSPTYRACIGSDNKSGGDVTITYQVKILQVPAPPLVNPEPLTTLLYDFSGSSYHYNSDYGISTRFAQIIDPATAVTISKAFSPGTVPPGGTSTLAVTLTNTASITIDGANFSDSLPILSGSQMVVATPATYSTSGCGSAPTLSFTPIAGATSFSVTGATIAPNGSCAINLSVSVPATPTTGSYANQVLNFKIGTSPTAGISSNTANLVINSATGSTGTGACGKSLATWTFPTGSSTTNPAPTTASVAASASIGAGLLKTGAGASPYISTTTHATGSGSWTSNGLFDSTATLVTANNDYFEFAIDTTDYLAVDLRFWAQGANTNSPEQIIIYYGTTASLPGNFKTSLGTPPSPPGTVFPGAAWADSGVISFTSGLNASGLTYFRIYGAYAKNNNPGSDLLIDDVTFTGCGEAQKPEITKIFTTNPVVVGGISTLKFTLSNPDTVQLTGAKFIDALPSGLNVAAIPNASTTCTGSPSWNPLANDTTLNFGQTTGANIPASGSCDVFVDITASTSGPHGNVSGFISSTESGTNATPTGSARASLVAVLPPVIGKVFNPNPILPEGKSTLTFTIINPNPSDALPNVAFTDTFPTIPGNMVVATPANSSTSGCGSPVFTPVATTGSITFANGTIAAGGTCTIKVDISVPAVTTGDYANNSSDVTTTIGGSTTGTDTASSILTVNAPRPGFAFSKQISSSNTGPWSSFLTVAPGSTVYYKFSIENTGDVPLDLTKAPVIDDPDVSTAGCTWPASLPVASPSSDPTSTCMVSVTAAAGDHPNTATATAYYGAVAYTPASSADYYGAALGLNLSKQISTSANGPWSTAISTVTPGSNIYYRFTVINSGVLSLDTIAVTDPTVNTAGCTFTDPLPANSATTCVIGPIASALTGTGAHINTAHATGVNGVITYTSPDSSASYTLAFPSLGLAKSNAATSISANGTTTYTLIVSNTGNVATSGTITVVDVLPTGLSVADGSVTTSGANAANWTCTAATNVITCSSSAAIAATSGSSVFGFTANVGANASGILLNKARVGGGGDLLTATPTSTTAGNCTGTDTPEKGCATDSDTFIPVADLSVTKTDDIGSVSAGGTTIYTVRVTNNGPSSVTSAMLKDTVGVGLNATGVACSATPGQCVTDPILTDLIGDTGVTLPALTSGQFFEIMITATVTAGSGSVTNSVSIAPPSGTTDPTPENDTHSDTDTVNLLPLARPDIDTATEGGPAVTKIVTTGLLSNDTLGDTPTTVTSAGQGLSSITIGTAFATSAGGSLTLNADGSYSYTPPAQGSVPPAGLTEIFDYTITDSNGDPSSSTLTITVSINNLLPVASADTNTATEGGPAVTRTNVTGLLSNDTLGDTPTTVSSAIQGLSTITIGTAFTTSAGGSLTINADGSYSYTPPAQGDVPQAGLTEVFDYTITDNDGDTSSSTLTITVNSNNLLPVASADTNTAIESGPAVTKTDVTGLLSNDTLGDTPTTVTSAGQGASSIILGTAFTTTAGGSLTLYADGSYSYTPPAQGSVPQAGLTEVFDYTITDSDGDISSSTLTITVDDNNLLPLAVNDNVTATAGSAKNVDVLINDTQLGDTPTSITSVTQGSKGTVSINDNGTPLDLTDDYLVYTPGAGTSGNDSFTYTICDNTTPPDCSTATVGVTIDLPLIGTAKQVGIPTKVSPGMYEVTFDFLVQNYGSLELTGIQVTDNLETVFKPVTTPATPPTTYSVQSLTSSDFHINSVFDGNGDQKMLDGSDTLSVGEEGRVSLVVRFVPASAGPFSNFATASGDYAPNKTVQDISQDGTDPDNSPSGPTENNGDGDPTNNNDPSPLIFDASIFDPPFGIKTFDESGLPLLQWNMIWINESNISALPATVYDPIPAGTTFAPGSTANAYPLPPGAPAGSSNMGIDCHPATGSAGTTTSLCYFEGPTLLYPRGRVIWQGTIGPDLGAADAQSANNELYIVFNVTVANDIASVQNVATINADFNKDDDYADPGETTAASTSGTWTRTETSKKQLPATGFAPGIVTDLPALPLASVYNAYPDLSIEIPALRVYADIVGVPFTDGKWDITWLGANAGYLDGTAFPTWQGNSVITSHVYMSNGLPGPFVNLGRLKWGDRIVIHAFGQRFIYEVRSTVTVRPDDVSVLGHKDRPWVTLITCKEFDLITGTYKMRTAVQAVLISIETDQSRAPGEKQER